MTAGSRPGSAAPARRRSPAPRRPAPTRPRAAPDAPWILGFAIFFVYPLVTTAYLSFTHFDLLSPPKWIGLDNYRFMLHDDPRVWPAIRNTLWIIAVSVPAAGALRVSASRCCWRACARGAGMARTIFYLPALVPPVAATLGFVYLLNPATGPVNTMLGVARHPRADCGSSRPTWAKPSLVLLAIWARRQRDGDLPGRGARRAARSCTRPPRSTAPARSSGSGTSRCRPSRR